jgi:hypothetical protein
MIFGITLGGFRFEWTRTDVLLRLGKRELYWSSVN